MFRLSNISIGIKLSMMSGLGILLVVAMIGAGIHGSSATKHAYDEALKEQVLARDFIDAKASIRGMMVGVRDIRLAASSESLQDAVKYLEARKASASKFIERSVPNVDAEDRVVLQSVIALIDQYASHSKAVAALRAEIIGLGANRSASNATETAARIAALGEQANRIVKEKTLPAAAELSKQIDKVVAHAIKLGEKEAAEALIQMALATNISLGVGAAAILVLIVSAFLGAFTIARPLKALVKPLEDVAGGNFAITVPGTDRKDEVGQIAEAVQLMAHKVSSTIGEIKNSGREVTNASAEISTSTTDLSQRTEEQAASLEETSAAMEQLSATVKKNAENAQLANTDANNTRDVADRGGQVVAKAVEAMAKIEDSSRKISDIIGVIDEIARQTNLLALNAAVEAARAGEAGRGFAVVASEVRSLAQRSSQAAKDIKDLITSSNGQVKDGVELVSKAGESLTEIVESIKKVAAGVSDIANASIEQATGIEQINKALTQMDEVTQQNSALVEENAATAKTLEHQAKAMDDQVAFFQIAVGDDRGAHAPPRNESPAPRVAAAPSRGPAAPKPRPVAAPKRATSGGGARGMQTALATAVSADADWKEF